MTDEKSNLGQKWVVVAMGALIAFALLALSQLDMIRDAPFESIAALVGGAILGALTGVCVVARERRRTLATS